MKASSFQTPDELLTVKDVAHMLCVAERTVWKWANTGEIPKPVKLTRKCVRWKASEIQSYLDSLAPSQN